MTGNEAAGVTCCVSVASLLSSAGNVLMDSGLTSTILPVVSDEPVLCDVSEV